MKKHYSHSTKTDKYVLQRQNWVTRSAMLARPGIWPGFEF